MADKTYKMQVTLTDNRVIDAGTFVAPQGPQGPKGDPGTGSNSPILLSQNYNDGSGYVVLRTSGTMYYATRSSTAALSGTTGGASVNNIEFASTTDEYFIIIKGVGSNISLENDDGVLANITTTTNNTFVKVSPGIDDGGMSFNITIISEYYPS